jgi:hypothetical protein
MVTSLRDEAWLGWMARLLGEPLPQSRPEARLPASSFFCLLDEQPTHLVPRRLLYALGKEPADDLILSPDCQFSVGAEPIGRVFDIPPLPDVFAKEMRIVWVRDAGNGVTLPFWMGSRFWTLVTSLQRGTVEPSDLPADVRAALIAAGLLVVECQGEERRVEWEEIVSRCAGHFRENGYVAVGGLIHPFHLAALRCYYRHMIRNGKMHLGDEHNPRRYVAHNDPVARFFHLQLASVVSSMVGERVKPSYVYAASYLSGEELKKHVDREQCEFSISLCLDFSPEPECETPWPLRLDTRVGGLSVYQALGDALLYRGRELAHYRDPLPVGRSSTSIFFHYVSKDFAGSLD